MSRRWDLFDTLFAVLAIAALLGLALSIRGLEESARGVSGELEKTGLKGLVEQVWYGKEGPR